MEDTGGLSASAFRAVAAGAGAMRLVGELDLAGVPGVEVALAGVDGDLVIDCSGLTFIDCAGLRVLLGAHQAREAAGAHLILVDPAPCLTRLLELAQLDTVFTVRSGRTGRGG